MKRVRPHKQIALYCLPLFFLLVPLYATLSIMDTTVEKVDSNESVAVVAPTETNASVATAPVIVMEPTPAPTSIQIEPQAPISVLNGKIICVDAGHGIFSQSKLEPVAPGSTEKKAAFVSGTSGASQTEEQFNLKLALKLESKLSECGATVLMTRSTEKTDKSNIDRAEMANEAGADLMIRIHADGSTDKRVKGISMLIPADKYIKDVIMLSESKRAGEIVLSEIIRQTGAKNRGLIERSDLTGFNWSTVPVILLEAGYMTNVDEDKLLASTEYQDKIVQGIVDGLLLYFVDNSLE